MAGDLADQAYAHALAVLGNEALAVEAAVLALRRAGRSRASALAHTRYQALQRAGAVPAPAGDAAVPPDVVDRARLLAATRPAEERAVVDLRRRLDRSGLGRALGINAGRAAEKADAYGEAWDRELDPMLMASLGPGDCTDLAAVLADAPLNSLDDLAAVGPAVAAHIDGCPVCTDRRRAMMSVRDLLAQSAAAAAPDAVRDVARSSRRMRPGANPPSIEGRSRWPVVAIAVGVALLTLAVVGGAAYGLSRWRRDDRAGRVAQLTRVPPTGDGLSVAVTGTDLRVANRDRHAVSFHVISGAPWLVIRPSDGKLGAGEVGHLALHIARSSPEGPVQTTITTTADDGSAVTTAFESTVEWPPDVAAHADACRVTATAEDEDGIGAVTLHWSAGGAEHTAPMTPVGAGYTAELPESTALTWWTSATDTRGNTARTPDTPTTC